MQLSIRRVFYIIATIIGLFAILIIGKVVLIPIAFALLISFILFPVALKLESWGANITGSALLSILGLLLIIAGGIFLFSNQIIQLSENLSDFKEKILSVFADVTFHINQNMGIVPDLEKGELFERLKDWLNESASALIGQTFSSTANTIFGLLTSIVFTFLILIYRKGLVRAFVNFYPPEKREKAFEMFKSIQQVGQQYLFGMMIIMLILGLVNSIGLWLIGIDNPFFFGFLAGLLALIPYAGTIIGASIPILYSFVTYDSIGMPITIAIFFWFVQFIESNFLSPKIVGGNLKVNAFTSILSIIIGASVWGVAGMILFLPFAAMFKVFCAEHEGLKPIALLIGKSNYVTRNPKDNFLEKGYKKLKTRLSKYRAGRGKE